VQDVHPCAPGVSQDLQGATPEGCTAATVDVEDREQPVEAAMPYGTGAPTISPGDRVP